MELNMLKTVIWSMVYMLVGPSLIMLNKYIMQDLDFPYPMFLSGLGVLVSGLVSYLLIKFGFVTYNRDKFESIGGRLWYKRVLPVGLAHAATLAFGNIVYLFLNVGLIQMLKSFTPVVMVIMGYITKIEVVTTSLLLSILVISFGTAITCVTSTQSNDSTFSLIGLIIMFSSEIAEAIRLLLTQFLLQNLKFNVIENQYIIAPASTFWLFLASLIFEMPTMIERNAFLVIFNNFPLFLLASCMGLGVNYLSNIVIQLTSSLTMKVLGTLRNIFTIFLGVLFYSEAITSQEVIGYSIALLGFVAYNLSKAGYWDSHCAPVATSLNSDEEKGELLGKSQPPSTIRRGNSGW